MSQAKPQLTYAAFNLLSNIDKAIKQCPPKPRPSYFLTVDGCQLTHLDLYVFCVLHNVSKDA